MEINYLKIIQCDFLDSISQLKCTYDENYISLFFVSETLKNQQCIKYLFASLYIPGLWTAAVSLQDIKVS